MIVTELTSIDEILKKMQKNRVQLAVVVDEYGGTAGLLTIEDILEQIVGEIQDEHDEERNIIEELEDGRYSIDARLPIADFNREFDQFLKAEGVFTLGGWFLDKSHKRPELGQSLVYQNLRFTITEYEKNTIRHLEINFLTKLNSG